MTKNVDDSQSSTFLGQKMWQDWNDLRIWEAFFREHRISTMIEFGTDNGGMTLYFALQAYQRKFYFHTFDNQKWIDFSQGLPNLLNLEPIFHHVDLFSEEGYRQVSRLIEVMPHPIAIFFDDGDKPREWRLFAPLLSPGDFLIVHDWGREFFQKDLGDIPVTQIMTDLCKGRSRDSWKAMWYKKN